MQQLLSLVRVKKCGGAEGLTPAPEPGGAACEARVEITPLFFLPGAQLREPNHTHRGQEPPL